MTAHPRFFGPPERPLFGWVHVPKDGRATGAVVLCPPLARELNAAQAAYRRLAEGFAEAGMLAVRFDYDGTGDSAGSDADPGRVAAWVGSISCAVDLARSCGAGPVTLVGMRMGALLAAAAAPRLKSIDAIVLWDPCPSGRAFVREQSALLRLLSDEPETRRDGTALPGFVFAPETVADLSSLTVAPGGRPPARVLLLTRPGTRAAQPLAAALGAEVTHGTAFGQDELLEAEPLDRRAPSDTAAEVIAWVRAGVPGAPAMVEVPGRCHATFEASGAIVTERVVELGDTRLFGILSEPERDSDAPTALFLNAGPDSHIGPNRLWVELSRRWAATGVPGLRFDLSGLGDSPTRTGRAAGVVRSPDAFDDVAEARAAIAPDDPGHVLLVGLCSGGYQALEEALARPVKGLYAVNPVLHFAPPELAHGPLDPRRRICWPTRGISSAYRSLIGESVRRRLRPLAWFAARALTPDRAHDPRRWLGELRRAGVRVFVVSAEDQGRALAAQPGRGDPLDPIHIEVVPGLDGALMPAGQRERVTDAFTDDVVARFAPGRARTRTVVDAAR